MPKFSFVIPCYRSEKTITTVVDEIKSEMAAKRPGDTYEIKQIAGDRREL